MELLTYTENWVKGEVLQGKIMVLIGALLLIAAVVIWRSNHEILRGMLIPLGLIILLLVGYGGFQTFGRPGHITKVSAAAAQDETQAMEQEYQKARKDDQIYRTVKMIWPVLIVLSVGMYFWVSQPYYQGLSIGFMGLFLTLLILDSTLQYRLKFYLEGLTALGAG